MIDLAPLLDQAAGRPLVLDADETYTLDHHHDCPLGAWLQGNGAVVRGVPDASIEASGGRVRLEGVIHFEGFNDASGDPENDDSRTRRSAAFNIIGPVDDVVVSPGISAENTRTFLRACHGSSDYKEHATASIGRLWCHGLRQTGGVTALNLSCPVNSFDVRGVVGRGLMGGGRRVGLVFIGLDGAPPGDPIYDTVGDGLIQGCVTDGAMGLVASTSQPGGNREVRAIEVKGHDVALIGNHSRDVVNVHGSLDAEDYYIKCRRGRILGNAAHGGTARQAAINVKGKDVGSTDPKGPGGHDVVVDGNVLTWDVQQEFATGIHVRNPETTRVGCNNHFRNAAAEVTYGNGG